MPLRIVQVDAFTNRPFAGNPAAVCVLPAPRDDAWMQAVAREMNLSETAFLHREHDAWRLRWFTPTIEVALCGHASLASAHVLWQDGHLPDGAQARFATKSGLLTADRRGDWIELDFPGTGPTPGPAPEGLTAALGVTPRYVGKTRFDYFLEVANEEAVRALRPDFSALERGEVGAQRAHRLLVRDLEEVVEAGLPHVARGNAEGGGEPLGSRRERRAGAGEVQLDPVAAAVGGEQAALGGETGLGAVGQVAVLPEHVSAGQRRVAAQRHLDGRREPPQPPRIVLAVQKGRLRKIHLAGDGLHPRVIARGGEDADGGGVTGERPVRERVHLDDAQGHARKISPGASSACRAPSLGVSS